MFLTAIKTIIVEALTETLTNNYPDDIVPSSITIEYPEEETDWPALLVQFDTTSPIEWTGLNPDYWTPKGTSPETYDEVREGSFGGNVDLTILALTSEERDRLWDTLVSLVIMGDKYLPAAPFFEKMEGDDLINITINKTTVIPVGSTINVGTPWDGDVLTYEATVRFSLIGQFWTNIYTQELISFTSIKVLEPYREDETPPEDNDDQGNWLSVSSSDFSV